MNLHKPLIVLLILLSLTVGCEPSRADKPKVNPAQRSINLGAHCAAGLDYVAQGKYELAKVEFTKSIDEKEKPSNLTSTFLYRSDANLRLKDYKNAIVDADVALADKNLPWANKGKALCTKGAASKALGLLDDAAKSFEEALAVYSEDTEAHEGLADVYELQGKKDKALEHLQEALNGYAVVDAPADTARLNAKIKKLQQ